MSNNPFDTSPKPVTKPAATNTMPKTSSNKLGGDSGKPSGEYQRTMESPQRPDTKTAAVAGLYHLPPPTKKDDKSF